MPLPLMWARQASVSLLSPDGLAKVVILASLDADELLLSFQGLKLPYQVSHSPNPSIIVHNTPLYKYISITVFHFGFQVNSVCADLPLPVFWCKFSFIVDIFILIF